MHSTIIERTERRFRRRVVLPAVVVLLLTAILCGGALVAAGRGTDALSLEAQKMEVWRGLGQGMDELSLAQESLGLCEQCMAQAASRNPDLAWLDANVGARMQDLADSEETYIVGADGKAKYAYVGGQRAPAGRYENVADQLGPLVALARGQAKRPSGFSNMNERLPDSPQFPTKLLFGDLEIPEGTPETINTARTRTNTIHATDLAKIDGKIAVVSAMRMAYTPAQGPEATADAPVLVNVHYLGDAFMAALSQKNYLVEPRMSDDPAPREGEEMVPVTTSDGVPLTHFFWKPLLGGAMLIDMLKWPAAGMFTVIALMVLLMATRMRRLMTRDDERIRELHEAHLELKAKEAQAHHLAYHDVLTGLPNRALFNDTADNALLRARHGEPMVIALLDLDRFKNVNDRFGHLAGDELIQQVGRRLAGVLAEPGAVARLGGDEFAILLQGEDLAEGVEAKLDRILDDLHKPYEIHGNQAYIGVSIGVAPAPQCGTDRTDLMRKADIALYRAKDEGRDCYRFFTDTMDETVQLRAELEEDLREALATGSGLSVHYQPLVDSGGRKVTGLEALLRWEHPKRGWVAPPLFVPVAEETGLISELGDWVLGEACKVAQEWPALTVSVNLSPIQFCDEGLAERICTIVRDAGVSPHQIEFEVTEGVVLDQNETVRGALSRLRKEGFRIALDDFGTGYSSLSYLRDFEVDRIKIDKSFIQNLGQTLDAAAIVTAVVTLGHAMGLQVTAEGVETSDQEDFLRTAGCNVLQGFLFSKAVPANELGRSLKEHARRAA